MLITPYYHGDKMNLPKFSSLKMFNIMVMWWAKFQHHNFHEKEIVDLQTCEL